MVKSDYYNNDNFCKKSERANTNSIKYEKGDKNKKSRRNMASLSSKCSNPENGISGTSELDEYQQRVLFQET